MAHEQQQEELPRDSTMDNRVAKQDKTDSWQTIGVIASLLFGIWGAGLSTWQHYESKIRDIPIIYGQLTVSKLSKNSKEYEIVLNVHNAGINTITLEPTMQIIIFSQNENFVTHSYIESQILIESDKGKVTIHAPLPISIDPGKSVVMKRTITSSSDLFGQRNQYAIIIRDSRHEQYRETFSGKSLILKNKTISMVFESRPLIQL